MLHVHHLTQFRPRPLHVVHVCHFRQRATGLLVGYEHCLAGLGQDGSRLGHKVNAAKDNVSGLAATGSVAGQLERVAAKIGELDHLVLLVVMAQDHEG